MELARRFAWILAGGIALAACSRGRPATPSFSIARVSPAVTANAPPLLLNDAVTVYFSGELMPVSVTPDAVTMVDELGHAVPGSLRVGPNWVTFQPIPPLTPELNDGSFRPGASYDLMVAGSPRPDAVRSVDGRRLDAAAVFRIRIARLDQRPAGLPAVLRPPGNDLPFVLRTPDQPLQLAADQPRLRLHFTQPVLPTSAVAEAFSITLLGSPLVELVPRSVRIVTSRATDFVPGCTVEIDLGAMPQRADGGTPTALQGGEHICVQLRAATPLLDYSGAAPLPASPQWWSVVQGDTVAMAEWPRAGDAIASDDGLAPTFEAHGPVLRPRVRVEAGDGSLGVFRPSRDMLLRPGEPIAHGDGGWIVSRGNTFPFAAIDIPEGVTVRIDATGSPVQLLSLGSVRIAGTLEVLAAPAPLPSRHAALPVAELAQRAPVAVVAAGDIDLSGRVTGPSAGASEGTLLLLASAGTIDLRGLQGELPFHTMLAFDAAAGAGGGAIRGPRGQSVVFSAAFTYGAAAGADFQVRAVLPWRPLPLDRDAVVVHFERNADVGVALQSAPPDAARKGEPDLGIGRVSRLQAVADGDTVTVPAGAFVRRALTTRVVGGQEPPRLRELRLCDR
jgi:hypothetical protein